VSVCTLCKLCSSSQINTRFLRLSGALPFFDFLPRPFSASVGRKPLRMNNLRCLPKHSQKGSVGSEGNVWMIPLRGKSR